MISTPREAARGAAEGLSAALHCIEDSRQAKTGRGWGGRLRAGGFPEPRSFREAVV